MRQINGAYTRRFNRRHHRVGLVIDFDADAGEAAFSDLHNIAFPGCKYLFAILYPFTIHPYDTLLEHAVSSLALGTKPAAFSNTGGFCPPK